MTLWYVVSLCLLLLTQLLSHSPPSPPLSMAFESLGEQILKIERGH